MFVETLLTWACKQSHCNFCIDFMFIEVCIIYTKNYNKQKVRHKFLVRNIIAKECSNTYYFHDFYAVLVFYRV